jgi:hypothetical protein
MIVREPMINRFEEAEDTGPSIVVMAYDPGETTGWSAWRSPVGTLLRMGTRKAITRSKWGLGQLERIVSGNGSSGNGSSGDSFSTSAYDRDSEMVDRMLSVGRWAYEEFVYEGDEFVVVLESFTLRMMSMDSNLLAPVRINSIFRDRMRTAGSPYPVFMQSPSDAKNVVTDARLKEWGVYEPGREHGRDAQRHAILFLRRFASTPGLRRTCGL